MVEAVAPEEAEWRKNLTARLTFVWDERTISFIYKNYASESCEKMKLLRPLPPNRSAESLENQYLVEKDLADRLRTASKENRKAILATMYDELFEKVPDHSRLTRRKTPELTQSHNQSKHRLIRNYVNSKTVFLEFGAGDCQFASEVAEQAKQVIAVDISDQRDPNRQFPSNLQMVTYDGENLDSVANDSVDVVFSDQLLEHLHPDDTREHFRIIHRILRKGGCYIFRTPHAHDGPHDISKYFSYTPQGFHLKEWTFRELRQLVAELGYSSSHAFRPLRKITIPLPMLYLAGCESVLGALPGALRVKLAKLFIPPLVMTATK